VDFRISLSGDHQRALSLLAKDEIELLITGTNLGALAYNKGVEISLLNVNVWGIDYVLTYGFQADDWASLRGRTLCLPLKGGPLDFVVRYLIQKAGVGSDDITLIYRPLVQGAKYFQTGSLDAIVLPEPLVTLSLRKAPRVFLSIDVQKEWAKYHRGDGRIPFVGLFVSSGFAEKYPELIREFEDVYARGVWWVNENPGEAAEIAEKYLRIPSDIFLEALDRTNFRCISSQECREKVEEYFNDILEVCPQLVGGRLPDAEFYQ